ncbi:ABC transporter permease [Luxibacter massiliensis]|uniref:ABC transporter permease n=1 Tax=Luxibacter massiliensis TaxID=2219695 RepID=UPI000F05F1F8|nr:ABC transporter permease [Luxibacter massiliensis]
MSNLLRAEFYKLSHSWYFWGIGLFNLFLSSLLLLDSNGKTPNLFFASLYNTPLLYFLMIVFAVLFAGNDFEQKTMYLSISAGHKRSSVILAKTIVYETACAAILFFPLFIHGLAGTLFHQTLFTTIDSVFITMAAILFSTLAMCMLPLFFSLIFRDIGKTLAVPMILFFLMIFLMNGDQEQVITGILPMGQLRLISLQQLSLTNPCPILIDFLWIFVLYFGASMTFARSDLK